MRKQLLVLLAMVSLVAGLKADGFNAVHSPNGLDVWAVGKGGTVFHSVDGGATWAQSSQGVATLRSVFAAGGRIWLVGDNGSCFSSTDGGESFVQETPAGTTSLTKVLFLSEQVGFIAGENGTLLRTTNAGADWTSVLSGTSQKITSLAFADVATGYAAGTHGALYRTANGGSSWTSIAGDGWTKDITSVSAAGTTVYVSGVDAFGRKSTDGGTSWTLLNLDTDSQSDANGVFAKTADSVVFVGGGGYVRLSSNGGLSFSYGQHDLFASLNSIFFYDLQRGWACSEKNNVVLRTTDGGGTWQLPAGTTVTRTWVQKLGVSATVRGNAFAMNPWKKGTIYCALGTRVYASHDVGETWGPIATMPIDSGGTKVNSFYVSPKDTNLWVAAFGAPDRIVRSTNRGQTWTTTLRKDFSEYGMPLEMDGSHPDTLACGPEDGHYYRSTDFGVTWTDHSIPGFRSPCDIQIVRGKPNVVWVGDGVTGSGLGVMFRSVDGGRTFQQIYSTTGSEIPTIAHSALNNELGYASAWGSGGVTKTIDQGRSWNSVATTGSTWGVDVAKDDPNVVMYGVYGGATSYLSSTAGVSFVTSPLSGSNYAIYAYDRGTFLAQQSGGIYKYNLLYTVPTSNTQAISLIAPNGGETWPYGSVRNIAWTAAGVVNVKIEYQTSAAGSWQTLVASMPGGTGSYSWTIPNAPTTQARVRVSDVIDSNPMAISNNPFSITVASIAAQPASISFGNVPAGSGKAEVLTLTNSGTAALVVSSVTASNGSFAVGRSSFTIPPGQSDTLTVRFAPLLVQTYSGQLIIGCNAPVSPLLVPLTGTGVPAAALAVTAPNGGEMWNAGSLYNITWTAAGVSTIEISYKTSRTGGWTRIAQSISASLGTYPWTVPNTPSTQARLRLVDRTAGSAVDSSDNDFTIVGTSTVADRHAGIPTSMELEQNYPNPFNPSTVIDYGIPSGASVTLKVYNMIGQEIALLVDQYQPAGRYRTTFDARDLKGMSSGLYFYRLNCGNFSLMKKMMLVK